MKNTQPSVSNHIDSKHNQSNQTQLTSTQMRVDTHVSRRPAQTLAFPVRDVLLRFGVAVVFRHAEVWNANISEKG
jgi:hypothetical protein